MCCVIYRNYAALRFSCLVKGLPHMRQAPPKNMRAFRHAESGILIPHRAQLCRLFREEKYDSTFIPLFRQNRQNWKFPIFVLWETKKDLKPKFQVFFHSLELVEISGIEPLTS